MATKDRVIDAVRDWLDSDDWHYEYDASREIIRAGVNMKCRLGNCKLAITFNDNGYTAIAYPTIKAGEADRVRVMEYVTRANYALRNGNFEMDLSDGEVRYKTYTNCKGAGLPNEEVIKDSIVVPFLMFERYGDGLAALMMGFSDPVTEIEKAEA